MLTVRTAGHAALSVALALGVSAQALAQGTPTTVIVRAIARDAKAIGTGVGGAMITITDVATGKVLDRGEQQGATGDTQRILVEPRTRYKEVFNTPNVAHYAATLNLEQPTIVEITAEGPLDTPDYTYKASKTMLLVPGRDITGDGVILEIHGFRVTFVDVPEQPVAAGDGFSVTANVVMI